MTVGPSDPASGAGLDALEAPAGTVPSPDLPPPPDASLDRYLDALARVVIRHGLSHASVPDVAADLGVSRVTVYRHAGNVEQMARMLVSRELHRMIAPIAAVVDEADGPDALLDLMTHVITFLREHPVVMKVLADEPSVIGPFLVRELPVLLRRSSAISGWWLSQLMRARRLAHRDPTHLADWLGRIIITAVLAPPPEPLRDYLDAGLRPLLEPARPSSRQARPAGTEPQP